MPFGGCALVGRELLPWVVAGFVARRSQRGNAALGAVLQPEPFLRPFIYEQNARSAAPHRRSSNADFWWFYSLVRSFVRSE